MQIDGGVSAFDPLQRFWQVGPNFRVTIWLYSSNMHLVSLLAYIDASFEADRRGLPRKKLRLVSKGETPWGRSAQIVIHDISETGLLIEGDLQLAPSESIDVELPDQGPTRAAIVWTSGLFAGCQFDVPVAPSVVDAALLESEQLLERRLDQQTISQIASQLDDLSMAVARITSALDRAINQLSKDKR